MLYIKFTITDKEKFIAFKGVYNHMNSFRIGKYEEEKPQIDWETATEEEMDAYFDEDRPKKELYNSLFPSYANNFICNFFYHDNSKSILLNEDKVSFINYLEDGFEVDLNALENLENNEAIVKFSTGNYPYGGMQRFLMTLKAFDLQPFECFDGFEVYQFDWTSEFEHEAIILSEKTKAYLKR